MANDLRTFGQMMDQGLSFKNRTEKLKSLMFDPAQYSTRYNLQTPVTSSQLLLTNYKDFGEQKHLRLAELECIICKNTIHDVFPNGMKVYCLPECEHMLCSQCLTCHYVANRRTSFKIVMEAEEDDEVRTECFVSHNSNYTYTRCPFCL